MNLLSTHSSSATHNGIVVWTSRIPHCSIDVAMTFPFFTEKKSNQCIPQWHKPRTWNAPMYSSEMDVMNERWPCGLWIFISTNLYGWCCFMTNGDDLFVFCAVCNANQSVCALYNDDELKATFQIRKPVDFLFSNCKFGFLQFFVFYQSRFRICNENSAS